MRARTLFLTAVGVALAALPAAYFGHRYFERRNTRLALEAEDLFNAELQTAKGDLEDWTRRWERLKPHLDFNHPMVRKLRRYFAAEASLIARDLASAGRVREAEILCRRIEKEVDPGFFAELAERRRRGKTEGLSLKALVDWNNLMIKAANAGDLDEAGRIAKMIVSYPEWRAFIPANAILGELARREGDLEASERFYLVALDTTNAVPEAVKKGYAETMAKKHDN